MSMAASLIVQITNTVELELKQLIKSSIIMK